MGYIIFGLLLVIIVVILITNIRVVPQATAYVIERLGAYYGTWETGLHFKIPIIDRVAKKISLKEQVMDFAPQPVITKDNVTMQIDTIVFYQVTDSKLYTYGVERPILAIESLTATTLRNIIGEMELDHTLSSRDIINTKITASLDLATDKWGIKV
ncbi:MAG: paraslipin, partial [Angelakisella sp.]